jgi:hypothetical protein
MVRLFCSKSPKSRQRCSWCNIQRRVAWHGVACGQQTGVSVFCRKPYIGTNWVRFEGNGLVERPSPEIWDELQLLVMTRIVPYCVPSA